MARCEIKAEELTLEGFAAFGDVIKRDSGAAVAINGGEVLRHHDLARVDVTADGGRPVISIFQVMKPATLPFRLRLMERHLLSSQAFMPLAGSTYLVAVAPPGPEPGTDTIRCFAARDGAGINLHPGVWHHPLIALDASDFLVIDRGTTFDEDCETMSLSDNDILVT